MKVKILSTIALLSVLSLSSMAEVKHHVMAINKTDKTTERFDIDEIKSVKFNPAPEEDAFEAVDLGLSVEWATANLDIHRSTKVAKGPEGQGGHYGWGDPTGNHSEQPDNSSWTPYEPDRAKCLSYYGGEVPPMDICGTDLDIARVHWGGDWRMPSSAEQDELREKCTWTKEVLNNVTGYRVTGPNGNSIFLPAAGYRFASSNFGGDYLSYYWSGTLNPNPGRSDYAFYLETTPDYYTWLSAARYLGQSVRAVRDAYSIVLEQKNGKKHVYRIDEVEKIDIEEFTTHDDYYEAVDLGLSVNWAAVNLDIDQYDYAAPAPEVLGGYYGWGDPTGRNHSENEDDYPRYDHEVSISGTDLDLLHTYWGGSWRLPTMAECEELRTECTWTWETVNGKPGYRVTGKNGNSIFLPTSGWRIGETINQQYINTHGYYWSGTNVDAFYVYEIAFSSKYQWYYNYRYNGYQMRGVIKK
ncbi:MAG: hypothetical protein KBT09_10015 [Bacteroidales bacterium]|nr:hypothetical protein [Candidatus Sodaliphilus fimicaballi]